MQPYLLSPDAKHSGELGTQKQREISKLEKIFLEAESPNIEMRREQQAFTPVFSANKSENTTIIDLTEKSPPSLKKSPVLEEIKLASKGNIPPVERVLRKTALTGVFDLHETINTDCDLNQTHFTSCNDHFVAHQLVSPSENQLKCQIYEEAHNVQQQPVAQAPRRKRTVEEMDRLLKSVFEDDDDDEVLPCRALPPVVKAASLRDSAKLLSKPRTDLQSIVKEIIRPSSERTLATATRQQHTFASKENIAAVQQQQPFKNPYEVVEILESGGQAGRNKQEFNKERFQRDLNKSLQLPLRPFNESRNLNNICTASTSGSGRISLEVKATLKNTSNGVQPRESQLNKLREVFAGGKCPDELMRDFQHKF